MNLLLLTIPVSLLLAAVFVAAFIMAVRRDQFDDLVTPAHRMLIDDGSPATMDNMQRKEDADVG